MGRAQAAARVRIRELLAEDMTSRRESGVPTGRRAARRCFLNMGDAVMRLSATCKSRAIKGCLGSILALALTACAGLSSSAPHRQVAPPPPLPIAATGPCCGALAPKAEKLLAILDASDVENLWQPGHLVDWKSGVSEGMARSASDTHCSAFAAAMGLRAGVYLLRPPQHRTRLLATAQTLWMDTQAARDLGWWRVSDAAQAQALANSGRFVVASFPSPDPYKPGHIAIVRPTPGRTLAAIRKYGVRMTQAGGHNRLQTTERFGFGNHKGAFPDKIEFFAHDLPDSILGIGDPKVGMARN